MQIKAPEYYRLKLYYNLTSILAVLLKIFDPILQEAWLKSKQNKKKLHPN